MTIKYHLAQINIANAKADKTSDVMRGFVERLDEIHQLADDALGFIWRLETEDGDDASVSVFNDPLLLINITVWKDIDSLRHFVYKTTHKELIRDRGEWFDNMPKMHQALWWIPEGHIPTLQEAKDKLDLIRRDGPTNSAFSFAKKFEAPE